MVKKMGLDKPPKILRPMAMNTENYIFVYFIANGLKQGLNIVSFLAKQDFGKNLAL